jgi:hypothetical protein
MVMFIDGNVRNTKRQVEVLKQNEKDEETR